MTKKQKIIYILEHVIRNEDTIAEIWDIISSSQDNEKAELFETFIKNYMAGDYSDEETLEKFSESDLRQIKFDLNSMNKIEKYTSEIGSQNPPTLHFYQKIYDYIENEENFAALLNKVAAIKAFLNTGYAYYDHLDYTPIRQDIYGGDKIILHEKLLKAKRIIYDKKLQFDPNRGVLINNILETIPTDSTLRNVFLEEVFSLVENNVANMFVQKILDSE